MKKMGFALILVFIFLYIVPLGVRPMVMPDETRYAEISREMITTGDWVTPKLDGLRYFEKPVLGAWLNAISISLLGENAFAIRLPSAVSVGFSTLLIFFLVKSFDEGGTRQAILASAAFLTSFEVFGVGTFCILDSIFSMCVTATIVFFYFGWEKRMLRTQKNLFFLIAGICCGLAFLAKGFIAFVLPVIVIAPFLIWQRQWKELLRVWWIPLTAAAVIVLPWSLLVNMKEPDFWRYFFWQEHVQRFLNPDSGQHSKPFWFYIPIILAGALPWSTWLPNAVAGVKDIKFKDSFIRFMACWLLFPLLFFSACGGKIGTYILPCFPPLLILLVTGFLRWYTLPGKEIKFKKNLYTSAGIMCLIAATLIFAQTSSFISFKIYRSGEGWKWGLLVIAFGAYAAFLVAAGRKKTLNKRLVCCSLAPMLLMLSLPFILPDQFKSRKMPGEFLLKNENQIHPDKILISDSYMTPAVCWFYKRNDVYLFGRTGEFEYGLSYKDESGRLIDRSGFETFMQKHANGAKVLLITTEKNYAEYRKEMPTPLHEEFGDGFVIAEYEPRKASINQR